MSIAIVCLHCGKNLKAPDRLAGKRARCSRCASPVDVPLPAVESVADSPPYPQQQMDFSGAAISEPARSLRPAKKGGRWITWILLLIGAILPFAASAVWVSYLANQWAAKRALVPASQTAKPRPTTSRVAVSNPPTRHNTLTPPAKAAANPKSEVKEPKPDWKSVTERVETDDLGIILGPAITAQFLYNSFGRVIDTKCLCITVRVENKTKTRLIRWRGWLGKGTAEDEFGNKYKDNCPERFDMNAVTNPIRFVLSGGRYVPGPDTFGLHADKDRQCACNWTGDGGGNIGPDKVYIGVLYYEVPIEQAAEIRLTLPASVYDPDSTTLHRFRLIIRRGTDVVGNGI